MNCCDEFGNCRRGHGCPISDEEVDITMLPRTLQEAFGPGADLDPVDLDPEIDWPEIGDQAVIWAGVAVIAAMALLGLWGLL